MKKPKFITVEAFQTNFVESGQELTLVCGTQKDLQRPIAEPTVNRPGFALAGFIKHFAYRRIQAIGRAESSYLRSLTQEERRKCYERIFSYKIPCFVFCRGLRPDPEFIEAAVEAKIPVFRCPSISMRFVSLATHTLDELFAPRKLEIGCMMDILGVGVLIKGKSGIGKSECVLSLLKWGYSLVSDDATELMLTEGRELIGSPTKESKDFMEVRGIGVINVADMFGIKSIRTKKRLDIVVTLAPLEEMTEIDRLGNNTKTIEIMGVRLPHLILPVSAGRDTGRLVEVAAFQTKLRVSGHPSGTEQYNKRIKEKMERERKMKMEGKLPIWNKLSPGKCLE